MFQKPFFSQCGRSASVCFHPVILALALASGPLIAGTVLVGEGSSLSVGSGEVELGCADVDIAGGLHGGINGARNVTLSPGAELIGASVALSGDWTNNGPQALDVLIDWRDGCGVSDASMLGSSQVTALSIQSSSGREIRFDASGEQRVAGSLSLSGVSGNLLRLRSTGGTQVAPLVLDFGASQLIDSVDVAYIDSSAGQDIAPGMPADYNSVRTGLVHNWFMVPAVPVPALGLVATGLLVLLMILFGLFHQRRHPLNSP